MRRRRKSGRNSRAGAADRSGSASRLRSGASLFRSRVVAHEANAPGHVRQRVLPIILVFDGDVPVETLPFEFIEDFFDLAYASAVRHVVMAGVAKHIAVFQMTADDAAFQNLQGVHRIDARSQPMP